MKPSLSSLKTLSAKPWRDGAVLVTLWLLSFGVAWLLWIQPIWVSHQEAVINQKYALRHYQELQALTAVLPPESLVLAHNLPSLTPIALQSPAITLVLHNLPPHVTVKGGCGERHIGFTLAWQECQWSAVGDSGKIGDLMNQLAQQPAWIMTQARVMPQDKHWQLSVAGVTLSTLP